MPPPSRSPLFPYTTLFRSAERLVDRAALPPRVADGPLGEDLDRRRLVLLRRDDRQADGRDRSEEHTSELQSHSDLVCRLLLEKKNIHDDADDEPANIRQRP